MEEAKFKEREGNVFDKKYFPSLVKKALVKLQPNLEKEISAVFDKAGIFPLNIKRVLDQLPPEDKDENGNQLVHTRLIFAADLPALINKRHVNAPPASKSTSTLVFIRALAALRLVHTRLIFAADLPALINKRHVNAPPASKSTSTLVFIRALAAL
ncbi:hypothetical protein J6590_020668 [Homalodisca vitripennis]|nr:hypothetical protein J6590_020668 [Homalodisca vitripennis]